MSGGKTIQLSGKHSTVQHLTQLTSAEMKELKKLIKRHGTKTATSQAISISPFALSRLLRNGTSSAETIFKTRQALESGI